MLKKVNFIKFVIRLYSYTNLKIKHLKLTIIALVFSSIFEGLAFLSFMMFLSRITNEKTSFFSSYEYVKNFEEYIENLYGFNVILIILASITVLFLIIRELLNYIITIMNRKGHSEIENKIKLDLVSSVLKAHFHVSDKLGSGTFTEMIGLTARESGKILVIVSQSIGVIFTVLIYLFLLFNSSIVIAVMASILGIIILLMMNYVVRKINHYAEQTLEVSFKLSQRSERVYSFRRILKIIGLGEYEVKNIKYLSNILYNLSLKSVKTGAFLRSFVLILIVSIIMTLVIIFKENQIIDITFFVALLIMAMRFTPLILNLARMRNNLAFYTPYFERADKTIKYFFSNPDNVIDPNFKTDFKTLKPKVLSLKKIEYKYPDTNKKVISSISMTLNAGETVALVGPSGAGKTTLIDLISRLYFPNAGSIEIDGMDVSKIPLGSYRRNITYIGQDPVIFDGTIKYNMRIWGERSSEKTLFEALRSVNLMNYVKNLDQKLDTIIGATGQKMSGGQLQRFVVACIFLRESPICIMDEPTSSLDQSNELKVIDLIKKNTKSKSLITIVISHNWNVVSKLDRMIKLENGEIIYDGKPSQKIFSN